MLYLICCVLLLGFGFIVLRILVPKDYLKLGNLSPFIALLQALLFFVYGGFPMLYLEADWPFVPVSPFLQISGAILLFGGLAFLLYGMVRLGITRSIGRGSPKLAQSGIYALSRNPQATACGLYVIGFFTLWPSWYAVGWVLIYPILIHMMVLSEEEHLRRLHCHEYEDYCEEVPRFLGSRSFIKNSSD